MQPATDSSRGRARIPRMKLCHFLTSPGLLTGLGIFVAFYLISWNTIPSGKYIFEKAGESFAASLDRYIKIAELMIGLVIGSVAIMMGLRTGTDPKLPAGYRSPLLLIVLSTLFALLFAVLCNYYYEMWKHYPNGYSHRKYRLITVLGFSGVACFLVGYASFAVIMTQ